MLEGIKNDEATLVSSWQFLEKHTVPIGSSSPASWNLLDRKANICPQKDTNMSVHSTIIHRSPEPKTIQCPSAAECIQGMLLVMERNEWRTHPTACTNLKKQRHMQRLLITRAIQKRQICRHQEHICGCPELGTVARVSSKLNVREHFGAQERPANWKLMMVVSW